MLEESILALAASPLLYLLLFLFTTIDGFFPPIPSESVVIALAALAVATGEPNLALVVLVAAAGAFTGDQIAYAIGRRVHVRTSRLLRGKRAQRTLDWAEYALVSRGASFIIGARYIPVGRVAVNMTAGALHYPRRRFVGLTAFAAASWAVYSTAIGVGAGAFLEGRPLVAVLVGVVGGAIIGLAVDAVLSRVQNRARLRRAAAARSAAAVEVAARLAATQKAAAQAAVQGAPAHGAAAHGLAGARTPVDGGPLRAGAGLDPGPLPGPVLDPAPAMVLPRADRL